MPDIILFIGVFSFIILLPLFQYFVENKGKGKRRDIVLNGNVCPLFHQHFKKLSKLAFVIMIVSYKVDLNVEETKYGIPVKCFSRATSIIYIKIALKSFQK